jgi:bisphosphoglycerate-independent phosphoglycerate mutase (AlkP superfamily)
VPFILVSGEEELRCVKLRDGEGLSSVAPTILKLMHLHKPPEMTAEALL